MFRHIHHKILFLYFSGILACSLIILLVVSSFIHKAYFAFVIGDLKEDGKLFIDQPVKEAVVNRDLEFLSKIITKAEENCMVDILDAQGVILANSESKNLGKTQDLNREEFRDISSKGYNYTIRLGNDNFDILYVAVPIMDRNKLIGFVRVSTPLIYLEKTIRKLKSYILLIFIIAIIITFFISTFFAKNISFPLLEMAKATKGVSFGNFGREISIKSRDEIGILANSFNNMTRRLKRFEEERKQLINNISHELMTPITNIRGFVETLIDGKIKDRSAAEGCLEIIRKESDYLEGLIEELNLISRIDALSMRYDFQPFNVKEAIGEAEVLLSLKAAEKDIRIENNFADDSPKVNADHKALRQVFVNLIDNAIKYSPPHKKIMISVDRIDKFLKIVVKDEGVGIAPQDKEKIFERFHRLEEGLHQAKGLGLGLAIVREILSAHQAQIKVESQLHQGSQFIITFPLL